jgi:transposase
MLREKNEVQQEGYEVVLLDELVPKDHLLRKIAAAIDFSFIHDMCKDLYCLDNGRPAVEPEVLFKMLFIGYLYGIKSETRLAEEVDCNVAYKWFLGLKLTEKGPNHATISINRIRRFRDNDIAQKIFDEVLRQAVKAGLVGGNILYTDSTHIKAKANKHKKKMVYVDQTPKSYLEELDDQIARDRAVLGKKPFNDGSDDDDDESGPSQTSTRMESTTDPDCGQLNKEGKPDGFHYSEHRTVDSKNNIIVNTHVTAANIHDVVPLPEVLKEIKQRLGALPKYMGLDAGYHSAEVAHLLTKAGIQGVIGHRRHTHKTDHFGKYKFIYDYDHDVYICPEQEPLYWKTTNRLGYREYFSEAKTCRDCPRRQECFSSKTTRRQVQRHVWQDDLDQISSFTSSPAGKRLYQWRKETIEPSFAESKENHGLRYARMVGLANMREQCFMTCAVQNMKKMAKALFFYFFSFPVYSLFSQTQKTYA